MRQIIAARLGAIALSIVCASSALAADMTAPAPIYSKAPVPMTAYWTGFYTGAALGARQTDSDLSIGSIDELFNNNTFTQNDLPACTLNLNPCRTSGAFRGTAFRVGPYAGYNWQFATQWVAGIEGDWAWANNTTTADGFKFLISNQPPDSSFSVKTGWDASARLRLGYLATPTILAYVTGGAAWIQTGVTTNCGTTSCFPGTVTPAVVDQASVRTGWTVGGGLEDMFAANWILRAEYRYSDYGNASYLDIRPCTSQLCNAASSLNVGYNLSLKSHTATLGIAYKWGGP